MLREAQGHHRLKGRTIRLSLVSIKTLKKIKLMHAHASSISPAKIHNVLAEDLRGRRHAHMPHPCDISVSRTKKSAAELTRELTEREER